MRYLSALFLLLAACGGQRPLTIAQPEMSAMEAALDATVALVDFMGDPYCAGVAIENHVLTAAHCVDDRTDVSVAYRYEDVNEIFASSHHYAVVYVDATQDIAILNRQGEEPAPPATALIAPSAPFAGQKVVTIGHPAGLTYTITDGLVSHPRRTWEGQTYFQISSPIFFGNSGGPVFNRYGEVLGLASFLVRQPHLGGAVHWEVILESLSRYHDGERPAGL